MKQHVHSEQVRQARSVERQVGGQATSDGAGVKMKRLLSGPLQRRLDPFLMFDAFGSDKAGDYIAGFPEHPHRGFETITFMIQGSMRHKDSAGNEGLVTDGGVQWMTAGRGVAHSEMPEQTDGVMEGFQLWLNLPARDKLCEPWYCDIPASDIPSFITDQGASVRVIAGASHGVAGAVQRAGTEPLYLDIELPANATFEQLLPPGHNAFLYVYRGQLLVDQHSVPQGRMAILANEAQADGVRMVAAQPSRLILIAGLPLNEPIAQYGPFVMNTQAELVKAVEDFRANLFKG